MPEQPKKLLDVVRDVLRTKHYSYRTEQTYVDWIKRYILFHQERHPKDMGEDEIRAFLTRALRKVKTEMSLSVLADNLKSAINILGVSQMVQALA